MPLRLYIALHAGSGTGLDDMYRALFLDLLAPGVDGYDTIDFPARRVGLYLVTAPDATHVLIGQRLGVVAATPYSVSTPAAAKAMLDLPMSACDAGWKADSKAALEGYGINLGWVQSTDTVRTMIRAAYKMAHHHQVWHDAERDSSLVTFLRASLDATVGSLPVAVRDRIAAWMTSRGISTTGITGTTLLRDVQRRIALAHTYPHIYLLGEVI